MKNFFALILISTALLASSKDSLIKLHTEVVAKKTTEPVKIDGLLTENLWKEVPSLNAFIQRNPNEGELPTEKTEAFVAFDDHNLYVAVRCFDSNPDSIVGYLTRRDNVMLSDRLLIFLDPYRDKRSGYYFTLNSAGTITDGVLYNDDWDDNSWDGVWEGKSNVDDQGWTAEFKIPFSQIRFKDGDEQIWGFNIKRVIARRNEEDFLIRLPKNEGGFVSKFIELKGLDGVKPSNNVEILPYITGKAEYLQHTPGDPFNNGNRYTPGVGADLKMGIGSNLTLNATINPDFGQVEIDPAVINLSDVETFFSEKRPFFIQGASLFDFGVGGARNYWGFNWPGIDFFYSRRIGRIPQGGTPDAQYVDFPSGVHILGAAKLTGKVGDNWNVGTIHAVTQREFARLQTDGIRSEAEVEPLTYFGIARMQKEFNEGKQGIGFITTYTGRNFKEQLLSDVVNKNSLTGGIDGWTSLDTSKTWAVTGYGGFSHLQGTNKRMLNLQTNSQHYFQRPDAGHVSVDSNRTSLTGFAGRMFLVKQKGEFFFNSSLGFISPYFDVNDVGFISRADVINMHLGGGYTWSEPTSYYHYTELGGAVFRNYDFDKNITWQGIFLFGYYELPSFYWANWNLAYNPPTTNNRRTRGGPLTKNPSGYEINLTLGTDSRKNWELITSYYSYISGIGESRTYDVSLEYRPLANLSVSLNPSYTTELNDLQYVGALTDPAAINTYGKRYLFGELNQKTFVAGVRLNWTFTPNLSLQLYLQPLISSGIYSNYKELSKPNSSEYKIYTDIQYEEENNRYLVYPEGNGSTVPSFYLNNRDFNFKSLRGNAVLRWEYLPGSVIYFVWTQTRSDVDNIGDYRFGRSFNSLFDSHPDNIFAVKFTYWLNM